MKRISVCFLFALLFSAILATAQDAPPAPKPGPEQKNLSYLIGSWTIKGDLNPGPMGPGGKFAGTEHNEWLTGGFFVVSHSLSTSSMGKETSLAVYGYDSTKKVYTYDEYNSAGEAVHATGTFDGKVWTWTSDVALGDQTVKSRFIMTETSATSYAFKFELSQDGNTWSPVMNGTGNKAARTGAATKK